MSRWEGVVLLELATWLGSGLPAAATQAFTTPLLLMLLGAVATAAASLSHAPLSAPCQAL